jgi:hypothetical protein
MHKQRSPHRFYYFLVSALLSCYLVGLATPVHAYHTKKEAPTYLTGHVLPFKGVRVGLDYQSFGIGPRLCLSTMLMGYLIWPFTGDVAPNLTVRIGAIRLDPFYFALESGVVFVFLGEDSEEALSDAVGTGVSTKFYSIPVIGAISYHPSDQFLISADVAYFFSNAGVSASASFGDSQGMLAGDSLQVGVTLQYAFNRTVAFTLKWRYVAWAPNIPFEFSVQVDPETELELAGSVQVSSLEKAFQVVPGVAFSWKILNLRLGVGYGHFFIPTLGLVSSYEGIIPEFELYFRF